MITSSSLPYRLFVGGIAGVLILMMALIGGFTWYISTASPESFVGRIFSNEAVAKTTAAAAAASSGRPEL